jgi:hemerythrin
MEEMGDRDVLAEIHAQHRDLAELFASIEVQIRSAARSGDADALAELARLVSELEIRLPAHFALEEKGGYLSEELARAPRLSRVAARLLNEHAEFLVRLLRFSGSARRTRRAEDCSSLLPETLAFSEAIRKHERRENQLMREALMDDVGGSG